MHWEERISLYTDDILLYLTKTEEFLHRLKEIFQVFGKFSGFGINWSKSLIYPMGGWRHRGEFPLPLRIEQHKFRYLGIQITRDMEGYMDKNLYPMIKKLERDVKHWRTLPLFVLGRMAMQKIIALLQMLYTLQQCPFKMPEGIFTKIDTLVRSLIWVGGPAHIALKATQRSKYEGGIALPNICKY